jgi:hypothetical protein
VRARDVDQLGLRLRQFADVEELVQPSGDHLVRLGAENKTTALPARATVKRPGKTRLQINK